MVYPTPLFILTDALGVSLMRNLSVMTSMKYSPSRHAPRAVGPSADVIIGMRQKRDKRHLVTTGKPCSHGWIHDSDAWNRRKSLMRAQTKPCEYGDRLLCSRPLLEELSM